MMKSGAVRGKSGGDRLERLARFLPLYVITDRDLSCGRPEQDVVREAIDGGATAIQLRGKKMSGLEMYRMAVALRDITARHGVLFIVNDRLDVALATEADGVHLGQEDIPARCALEVMDRYARAGRLAPGAWPGRMVLGISVENVAQAVAAENYGADYLGAGPAWATTTKTDAVAPIGPEGIKTICSSVRIPVVAIGGISHANAGRLATTGIAGVAVVSAVVSAADVRGAARSLYEVVSAAPPWRAIPPGGEAG